MLLHHGELVVASDAQIWGTDTDHGVVGQVGILFDDDTHTGHFLGPIVDGGVRPEAFLVVVAAEMEGGSCELVFGAMSFDCYIDY